MDKRTIAHIEIVAKDPAVSSKFYGDLFGWKIENSGPPFNYEMFQSGNVPGGFPTVHEKMYEIGNVIVYISSDDLEKDGKRITAAGGKVLGTPVDIPGMGAFLFFADPGGARLALWKSVPATK